MNNFQKEYLNYGKRGYPKQNKGYTLHSMATKNFGMANSVSTIYYGSISPSRWSINNFHVTKSYRNQV